MNKLTVTKHSYNTAKEVNNYIHTHRSEINRPADIQLLSACPEGVI